MKQKIQFTVTKEGDIYVASGVDVPVVTDGVSWEMLVENVKDATTLYLEEIEGEGFGENPVIILSYEILEAR